MLYVANAFSLSMVRNYPAALLIQELTVAEACAIAAEGFESAVGHADVAVLFTKALGVAISVHRISVSLCKGDKILVGQYCGPRLPEGATTLPAGAMIMWLLVTV